MFELRVYGPANEFGVVRVSGAVSMRGARRLLEAAGYMVEVEDRPAASYGRADHPARAEGDRMLSAAGG